MSKPSQTLSVAYCLVVTSFADMGLAAAEIKLYPNVPVSTGARQAEPYIAAHPNNPLSLIISGSEIVEGVGIIAQSYISADGGQSWAVSALPRMRQLLIAGQMESALDNWVTFAPNGDAYYTSLALPPREGAPILVYRLSDGGRSWQGPVEIPARSFDQPRTAASMQDGNVRVYIVVSVSGKDPLVFQKPVEGDGVIVIRSDDGGRSFKAAGFSAPDNLMHQAMNPLVLTDGSLLVPYVDFGRQLTSSRIYTVRSIDHGQTFGRPAFVADIPRAYPDVSHFAVDRSTGRFRGRIYAAWEDGDFGPRRFQEGGRLVRRETGYRREVAISHSADNGQFWSEPKLVRVPNRGPAYQTTLAVNSAGVLGALWVQHEKYETDPRCYGIWFAASVDGGETFSAPVAVSEKTSCPDRNVNPEPYFATGRLRGGDYIGLAAGADSNFHAAWIDARDGGFRLYTTRIEVSQ